MVVVRSLLVVFNLISVIDAAKILAIFPVPSISHQVVFRPLIHELARRGHDVTLITPDPAFQKGHGPANLKEIDVHDVSYENWNDLLENHSGKRADILLQIVKLFEKLTSTFEKQILVPEVQTVLSNRNDTYDLIISEACVRATLGLAHLLKAPLIHFSSYGLLASQYRFFGAPMHLSLYPTPAHQRVYNLNIWEKFWEIFKFLMLEYLGHVTYNYDLAMAKRNFGDDVPSLDYLYDKYVQLLFVNEHPIWSNNRPVPPNIIFLGGIHQIPETKLSTNLNSYLDSSINGTIYISFGTNVKTSALPEEKIMMMTKVLSELPYNVLWKWDQDKLPGRSNNIKISKWLPQPQLLKHKNIKLFITQGGLQSTDEAITAAVPVIGIPMLGDQWYNTEKYVHHKIGLQLDLHRLTEDEFKTAIITVISEESYKKNVLKLRDLMRKHPISPLELAVWWTEHIIQFGGSHLRSPAMNISWINYYEIPLIINILLLLTISVLLIIYACRFLIKLILRSYKLKKC